MISVTCPVPAIPQFGVPTIQTLFAYGDAFSFDCVKGYRPTGTLSAVCGLDGSFGVTEPVCTLSNLNISSFHQKSSQFFSVQCPAPEMPENSVALDKDFFLLNERVDFQCEVGYKLIGDKSAVCQEDGTLTPSFFSCFISELFELMKASLNHFHLLVSCPPPVIPFALPATESLLVYGNTFEFECSRGYELTGTTTTTCQADGTFAPTDTACVQSIDSIWDQKRALHQLVLFFSYLHST